MAFELDVKQYGPLLALVLKGKTVEVNGVKVDVGDLVAQVVADGKLDASDLSVLMPIALSLLLPMILHGGSSQPTPAPTPVPTPVPVPVPEPPVFVPPPLTPPQPAPAEVLATGLGLDIVMYNGDWLRDHPQGDGTDRATRAILAMLRDGLVSFQPNCNARFAARVDPQGLNPIPYNEFVLKAQVDYAPGTGGQSGPVGTYTFAGPEPSQWSVAGKPGYIKLNPNRWLKTSGWEYQLVFSAPEGETSDYTIALSLSYERPDGKVIESVPIVFQWRHGPRGLGAGAEDAKRNKGPVS